MPYLTLGKFYLDLRALCSFVLVNGRLGLRQTLAPFALFRLSDYFEFTPYNPFGKPILVLDDESLLAFEAAAMRSALRTRFDELGGLFLLHNLYTPSLLAQIGETTRSRTVMLAVRCRHLSPHACGLFSKFTRTTIPQYPLASAAQGERKSRRRFCPA